MSIKGVYKIETKFCTHCKVLKSRNEFSEYFNIDGISTRIKTFCKECEEKRNDKILSNKKEIKIEIEKKLDFNPDTKKAIICVRCEMLKSVHDFDVFETDTRILRKLYCKECDKIQVKEVC